MLNTITCKLNSVYMKPCNGELLSMDYNFDLFFAAGQERFGTVISSYYRGAHGIILGILSTSILKIIFVIFIQTKMYGI